MHVKNAKKASSKLQKMQATLSRNCCSKNAHKLSVVIHCLQWITAKIALKMQWDFGHSGNLQNLQGNYLQCRANSSSCHKDAFFLWVGLRQKQKSGNQAIARIRQKSELGNSQN